MAHDEALYTGITSASFARLKEQREVREQIEADVSNILGKNGELILTAIEAEIDSVPRKVFDLLTIESTEETYKSTVIALKLYESYLKGLQADIKLKVKKAGGK